MILLFILLSLYGSLFAITDDVYIVKGTNRAVKVRPFTSLFGDRICMNRYSDLSVHFHYGIPTNLLVVSTSGSGSVAADSDNSMATLSSGIGEGAAVAGMLSKHKLIPSPFNESYLYSIVSFDTSSVSGTEQWIGLFDNDNGFAVGMKNNKFGVMYRREGAQDIFIGSSNFNVDKLDGTGFSRLNMDPSKINIFRMCTGWLGSTPIVFEVLTPEGSWYPFHIMRQANSLTKSGLRSPVLPVCAQVKRVGGSNDVSMNVIAVEAGIIGNRNKGSVRTFAYAQSNIRVNDNKTKPLLTIKNSFSYKGKPNLTDIHLLFLEVAAESGDARFSVVKNGHLTGANYSSIDGDSVVEKDTSASVVSGGKTIWYSYVTQQHGSKEYYLKNNGINISLMPGETLTCVAHGVRSKPDCDVSILWEEII